MTLVFVFFCFVLHKFGMLTLCSVFSNLIYFISSAQLTFGHFGQVVEKKQSITLQDITAVRDLLWWSTVG